MSDAALLPKRAHSTSPPPPAAAFTSTTSPLAKRVKLDLDPTPSAPALPASVLPPGIETVAAAASAVPQNVDTPKVPGPAQKKRDQANKDRKNGNGKGRKLKGKPPKPGGVEEAGAFDVKELLGEVRVLEMDEMDRDWKKESEVEWGFGAEGKEIQVRVVGMNAHGELDCVSRGVGGS